MSSYRLISLASTIFKVMETIISPKITQHCDKYKHINTTQYDFRCNYSVIINKIGMLNDITNNFDNFGLHN